MSVIPQLGFANFDRSFDGVLMSLAVGIDSRSSGKNMGFDEKNSGSNEQGEPTPKSSPSHNHEEDGEVSIGSISRQMSESSICATEEEEDDEERKIQLGPQYTLKEQLEKDKVIQKFRKTEKRFICSLIFSFVESYLI